ncbi:MAG: hypothetical protein Q9157_008025 [Trypethelium eluteriae]
MPSPQANRTASTPKARSETETGRQSQGSSSKSTPRAPVHGQGPASDVQQYVTSFENLVEGTDPQQRQRKVAELYRGVAAVGHKYGVPLHSPDVRPGAVSQQSKGDKGKARASLKQRRQGEEQEHTSLKQRRRAEEQARASLERLSIAPSEASEQYDEADDPDDETYEDSESDDDDDDDDDDNDENDENEENEESDNTDQFDDIEELLEDEDPSDDESEYHSLFDENPRNDSGATQLETSAEATASSPARKTSEVALEERIQSIEKGLKDPTGTFSHHLALDELLGGRRDFLRTLCTEGVTAEQYTQSYDLTDDMIIKLTDYWFYDTLGRDGRQRLNETMRDYAGELCNGVDPKGLGGHMESVAEARRAAKKYAKIPVARDYFEKVAKLLQVSSSSVAGSFYIRMQASLDAYRAFEELSTAIGRPSHPNYKLLDEAIGKLPLLRNRSKLTRSVRFISSNLGRSGKGLHSEHTQMQMYMLVQEVLSQGVFCLIPPFKYQLNTFGITRVRFSVGTLVRIFPKLPEWLQDLRDEYYLPIVQGERLGLFFSWDEQEDKADDGRLHQWCSAGLLYK